MHRLLLFCLTALIVVVSAPAQPVSKQARFVSVHPGDTDTTFIHQTPDVLVFTSASGTRTVSLPGTVLSVQPSQAGAFVGVIGLTTERASEPTQITLQVYGYDGSLRYTHRMLHAPDEPLPIVAVDDRSGAVAFGLPATGEVVLLGANGQEQLRTYLFDDAPYALERSLLLAFSADGATLAVAAMRAPAHPARSGRPGNTHLLALGPDGTIRWRRSLPQQALHALSVSDDGRWIGVSTYDAYAPGGIVWQSQLFTPAGEQAFSVPAGFVKMRVAADADVALLIDKRKVAAYDLQDGSLRYAMTPPAPEKLILDAALHPDGEAAVLLLGEVSWEPVYRAPSSVHLDADGRTVATQSWEAAQPYAPRLWQHTGTTGVDILLDTRVESIAWKPTDR